MTAPLHNPRTPEADVDPQFTDRWSPRSFSSRPLDDLQVRSLFEAARWAPSCFGEQPWLFLYARTRQDRERFLGALVEKNRLWAASAPLLVFVASRRNFAHNGRENRHAPFDAGAAWMSLALQARKLGLHAHAMAGFSRKAAFAMLQLPEDQYEIWAAVAVGYRDDPDLLPAEVAAVECPNGRKPLAEVMREGGFLPGPVGQGQG